MTAATKDGYDLLSGHVCDVVAELADRWRRCTADDSFTGGRSVGYAQSISLLLGEPFSVTLAKLKEGRL